MEQAVAPRSSAPQPDPLAEREGARAFLLTIILSVLLAAAEVVGRRPPAAKPATAPASEFSAVRAREVLQRLVGDGIPHPVGSPADAHLRERIVDELVRLGYEPSIETSFACGHTGACATVANVLARMPGRHSGEPVLLCAHYDSVGAGPGASDDGMGVAALLEIARIFKAEAAHEKPVIFLFDEGEESGLIGAEAFVHGPAEERSTALVVNVENRGTSGTSYLFETSSGNRWLVDLAAHVLSRPATSSLFYTVYKFLPNDTDLTVFKAHGFAGVNFAAVEGVTRYHTSRDDFAHASASTLQHHGDGALAMARVLADRDPPTTPGGDAVFFDLFGKGIVRWPEKAALPLAAAALLLVLVSVVIWSRREGIGVGSVLLGLLAAVAMPVLAGGAGFVAAFLLRRTGALPTQWIAHSFGVLATVWCLALACAWLIAHWLARRAGGVALWGGGWILWSALAALLSWRLAGISFLFFVPSVLAAVLGLLVVAAPGSSRLRRTALAAPAAAAAFFWLPVAFFLEVALGSPFGEAATGVGVGLWAATAAPAFASSASKVRSRILAALFVGAFIALVAASFSPPFTADSPERMSISLSRDENSGRSRWLVFSESGRLPAAMGKEATFSSHAVSPYPWAGPARALEAAAPDLALAPPLVSVREDSRIGSTRRVRLHVSSQRKAPAVFLAIGPSASVGSIHVQGVAMRPIDARFVAWRRGWRLVTCLTTPPEGVDFDLEMAAGPSPELSVGDRSPGLPPAAGGLLRARGPLAAPSGEGDTTVVVRRLKL